MSRQYLTISKEAAFNTIRTPTIPGDYTATPPMMITIRLDGGNAFTMRPVPQMVTIPHGGGIAVNAFKVSDKTACAGRLSVILCEEQAKFLLDWASTRISGTGTVPWTTTITDGDLASCTIYHAIQFDATTNYLTRTYSGCKVAGWDLEVSEDSQIVRLNLDLVASTANAIGSPPTYVEPDNAYLPVKPYLFTHLGGGTGHLTISTVRTQYTSLRISSRNALALRYFAQSTLQLIRWVGRTTTIDVNLVFSAVTDRTAFEALTQNLACSLEFDGSTLDALLALNAVNIINALADDLPNDNVYMQAMTLENMWDASATNDLAWTFTA